MRVRRNVAGGDRTHGIIQSFMKAKRLSLSPGAAGAAGAVAVVLASG
jgi:hypothetical protein